MVGHYKARWELDPKYSAWIKRCGDDTKFACKACARSCCIAEMYEQALDRHLEGASHSNYPCLSIFSLQPCSPIQMAKR